MADSTPAEVLLFEAAHLLGRHSSAAGDIADIVATGHCPVSAIDVGNRDNRRARRTPVCLFRSSAEPDV